MIRIGTALLSRKKTAWAVCFILFVLSGLGTLADAREITDTFGRKFSVPDRPQRVYSASPPVTYMLYAIDPAMLAGLNFPVREWEKKYLDKRMQGLPVLGGWFGQAQTPNLEAVLKANPEIIVMMKLGGALRSKTDETVMRTMPMAVVQVALDRLSDYPEAFQHLGTILGREARAKALASYARKTISEMAELASAIPDQRRVSVYYAEGVDGLSTDCDTSGHAELINLVGGRNVHQCEERDLYGLESISLEQVMLYNPDVILVKEPVFFKAVFSDPRWQRIRAVKAGRVYLIPYKPFNWFDRPPSFMRLLGAKWLAGVLYPERYRSDMAWETQEFFRLFLGVSLSVQETREILRP